jgi:uncharacterized membrane protein YeaQ/YmgE (transglycosylase-associated protein family)
MGILGWILLGLIAGAIAKAIMPGDDPGGILLTMVIGIVGAVIGGLIANAFGWAGIGDFFEIRTWILAILGSLLLLALVRLVSDHRHRPLTH